MTNKSLDIRTTSSVFRNSPSSETLRKVEVLRVSATEVTVSSDTSSGFKSPKPKWPLIRENEEINAKLTTRELS